MFNLIKIVIYILIVGLFLYSKLLPYNDKLDSRYSKIFNFFNSIFAPILDFFKTFMQPFRVGYGLSVDMTQILLLLLLLLISNSL